MNLTITSLTNYEIGDLIHESDRTIVYRGVAKADSQPVAIKLLRNEFPSFNELVQFRNQYTIARNLQIEGIVKPLELVSYQNGYALIMPDFGGLSLGEYYHNLLPATKDISQFLDIAIQITEIIYQLHQNRIIHKDIKPANILINPETRQVKIIDFSISSLLPKETQTIQNYNVLEGTLAYISPEQTGRMNRGIDYRSDFYSLGVTFFEMLNGVLPFDTTDPIELVHCHLAKMPILGNREGGTQIPQMLIDIVMKLMAKNAEDRYQSALGLKSDLKKCWRQWQEKGKIEYFELGERDISDRFLIPEKLYGREAEVEQLLAAFERVAIPPQSALGQGGGSEIILVAGFSGIGKTVVVNEVHKPIVRKRGYFIKGKFDQFNRNIPFSALVQSLRDLMGQLLSEGDTQLQQWKDRILAAVGENGQVIVDVIPELEKIIGKQPTAVELSGSAAQNRFNLLFSKFIQVFTTKEHPLVIFLDDLQWADSASLNLMKLLMNERERGYLLLIGAYRDNEVFPAHPLMLTLDEMRKADATINTITLAPLSKRNINHLVADTLSCAEEVAKPLTKLVYQKTKGNPFFTTQFLLGLYEDELIQFNFEVSYWECDITQVRQRALTDDVVEFMAGRLQKFPTETIEVLKLAACIGNQFDLKTLAIVCEKSEASIADSLWKALQEGLVLPQSQIYKFFQIEESDDLYSITDNIFLQYKFLHDRVQQAAYSLILDEQKQSIHLKIGQLLLQVIPKIEREGRVFEIVNQFNIGISLIEAETEKTQVAELNLIAAQKSKKSTAYVDAMRYIQNGISLLHDNCWKTQYKLTLDFYEHATEIAYLKGDFKAMEFYYEKVIAHANCIQDQLKVYEVKIQGLKTQNQLQEALQLGHFVLEKLGEKITKNPTQNDIDSLIKKTIQSFEDKPLQSLIDLPLMTDPIKLATSRILYTLSPVASSIQSELLPIILFKQLELARQYGNAPSHTHAFAGCGLVFCGVINNINLGYEFGQLALNLLKKINTKQFYSATKFVAAYFTQPFKQHLRESLQPLLDAYTVGLETGDLEHAGYSVVRYSYLAYFSGEIELSELEKQMQNYANFLVQMQQDSTFLLHQIPYQVVLNLIGKSEVPYLLNGPICDEAEMIPLHESSNFRMALFYIYLHKLILAYLFENISLLARYVEQAESYLDGAVGFPLVPILYWYSSLAQLATFRTAEIPQSTIIKKVSNNQKKLENWANYAPMNFKHKYDLVEAEKHRVLGQKIEAIELYDRAIAGAKENEYIQEEALANELAAKFYLEWGKDKIACIYMQSAYYCYARWGAKAKTDDLEKRYPHLLTPILEKPKLSSLSSATFTNLTQGTMSKTTIGAGEILDLATLMKASRTLSEDISLEGAIANLMQVVRKNAGAETVALMLFTEQVLMLTALVTGEEIPSFAPVPVKTSRSIPLGIINQVKHSQKPLVLDNATNNNVYAGDAYIQKHQPQSVLCLPLIARGKTIGILYLENNQLAGAFTRERVEVLSLLCSQAAISLENARLYQKSQNYAQQLEQTQLQLVQSEKMATVGQLTAGVAHEINNPVGFISGNLDYASDYIQDMINVLSLYRQTFPEPGEKIAEEMEAIELDHLLEDLPKIIDSMKTGIDRIAEISKSMRTFSRGDTAAKISFNLHDGIDSTLLIIKHRLKANENRPEIEVVKNYGNLPEINCYPGQLNQVFMNLIANAIDALEESNVGKTFEKIKLVPNQITITTEIEDETQQAIIRIGDNGMGISEEVRKNIFEHLFTTKGVGKGTGLGLSISRQIVEEKHGGKITCTSELGRGTEFTISLPNN